MAFGDRVSKANTVIDILNRFLWNQAPLKNRVYLVSYGYETHVPDNIRSQMRFLRTITSKFIRFTPDFFVIDQNKPDHLYLLEYKSTQTPLYSNSRITQIRSAAKDRTLDWQDIGQMEADAYDNYLSLEQKLGVRVALLNYCAYHNRLLICENIGKFQILRRDNVGSTTTGSGTPFVNFDLRSLRSFEDFLKEEHNITVDPTSYNSALQELRVKLPVEHARGSPLFKP